MQSTKAMLDSTSSALQEERRAHAETKRLLEEAQEQSTRLMRQHAEVQTLARTRADQLKGLSAQLQSTTTTNSRSRAVIESLEKERAALLRGIATVQSNERERVSNCQVRAPHRQNLVMASVTCIFIARLGSEQSTICCKRCRA